MLIQLSSLKVAACGLMFEAAKRRAVSAAERMRGLRRDTSCQHEQRGRFCIRLFFSFGTHSILTIGAAGHNVAEVRKRQGAEFRKVTPSIFVFTLKGEPLNVCDIVYKNEEMPTQLASKALLHGVRRPLTSAIGSQPLCE